MAGTKHRPSRATSGARHALSASAIRRYSGLTRNHTAKTTSRAATTNKLDFLFSRTGAQARLVRKRLLGGGGRRDPVSFASEHSLPLPLSFLSLQGGAFPPRTTPSQQPRRSCDDCRPSYVTSLGFFFSRAPFPLPPPSRKQSKVCMRRGADVVRDGVGRVAPPSAMTVLASARSEVPHTSAVGHATAMPRRTHTTQHDAPAPSPATFPFCSRRACLFVVCPRDLFCVCCFFFAWHRPRGRAWLRSGAPSAGATCCRPLRRTTNEKKHVFKLTFFFPVIPPDHWIARCHGFAPFFAVLCSPASTIPFPVITIASAPLADLPKEALRAMQQERHFGTIGARQ